ncbi:MAG: hypothetical protein R3C43_19245 [Chloroflexota bacterium]
MGLERQRLKGNILDEIEALKRRMRELEESAVSADKNGSIRSAGVLFRVQGRAPATPPAGFVLVYVQDEGGETYMRAMNDQGEVRELANWTADGIDMWVRYVTTGQWRRLYMEAGADGTDQLIWEELG